MTRFLSMDAPVKPGHDDKRTPPPPPSLLAGALRRREAEIEIAGFQRVLVIVQGRIVRRHRHLEAGRQPPAEQARALEFLDPRQPAHRIDPHMRHEPPPRPTLHPPARPFPPPPLP